MFFTSEDDEQDFLSPGGSKLASVFGMDKAASKGGNESLTYTAPKQPKKKESGGAAGEGGAAATSVNAATVVHAYKLVDGQYASQGKVGAAILASHAAHEYRVLLYVSKQQQLTNAKITPAFALNVQANNYANFYDDARVNWSFMFTSNQDAEKFLKEVGLCKAICTGGHPTALVQQDLQLGEGGQLETGDSVEAKYTGWLLSNNSFGQVFDTNTNSDKLFRFKVGKGKVIKGWDQGMLGMRKGGKRLLVIPPALAYGTQGIPDRVPANATLIFEVEVVRVKLQKGDGTPEAAQPPAAVTAPEPVPGDMPDVDPHDDTVKERSKSITEQLSHSPKSDKAKLISRMAKMGQPMLPKMSGGVPAQPDSEEEPQSPQPTSTRPQLPSKPHPAQPIQPHLAQPQMNAMGQPMPQMYTQQMGQPMDPNMAAMQGMQMPQQAQPAFLQNLPGAQQLSVYQPQPTLLQQQQQAMLAMQQQQQQQQMGGFPMATSQAPGYAPQPTPLSATHTLANQSLATSSAGLVPGSSSSDAMAPLLLSETRQQNTEMRMAVSKMSDKVERILEKVENLNSTGGQQQALPAPTMETSILLHNISRIVQENERLKKEVFERGEKIEIQNDKIAELLQKNQRYVEKSNSMLEERNEGYKMTANQSQSRILALEQEKVHMATELSSASAQLTTLQLELGEIRKKEGVLRQQIQSSSSTSATHQEELERLRLQRAEDEKKLADLTASLREEKTARKQSDHQLTSAQEELADLKATCSTLERNLNERKRKAAEERKKMEEEVEEVKAGFEQEIQVLREKLRKQRSNTDVATADRVTKMEEELTAEWQAKCDKLVAAATDKHTRHLATVKDELEEARDKAAKLEAKVQELRNSSGSTDSQLMDLQQQVEENAGFRDKYEHLRGQASSMKQRYEERIAELEQEVESLNSSQRELQQQLRLAKQQQQQQTAAAPTAAAGTSAADVATEVKKVMNSVYQSLREEFDSEENYTGSEVMTAILGVIKETTLKLVQAQSAATQQQEDEEDEDDEDEEEEDEEEEEEEEEEEKEVLPQQQTAPATTELPSRVVEDITKADSAPPAAEETSPPQPSERQAVSEPPPPNAAAEADHDNTDDETSEKDERQAEGEGGGGEDHSISSPSTVSAQDGEAASDPNTDESFHTPPSAPRSEGDLREQDQSQAKTTEPSQPVEKLEDVEPTAVEESVKTAESQKPEVREPEVKEPEVKEPVQKSGSTASDEGRTRTESESVLPTLASREPPPLFDADEDDDDSPLFGNDDTVADTLGSHLDPEKKEDNKKGGNNKLPTKNDLLGEDDMKPTPPPPLFGDDDDDDDLDWLS